MAGLQFPTEVLGSLSWNRLSRETYIAQEVPDPYSTINKTQIPPVPIKGNGYIYMIGCDSPTAPAKWRLGCSVRLASDGNPDSGGIFTNPTGFPIRIDDRKICTLGAYSLHVWPDLEIPEPWLILHFPHWLDEIEVEIFWYDGAKTTNFFEQIREAMLELYDDPDFLNQVGDATTDYVDEAIEAHLVAGNPHPQYLTKTEAASTYAIPLTVENAIAIHENELHDPFETEEQITSIAQQQAHNAIVPHLAATNPHNITPELIGSATPGDVQLAIVNHLAAENPHSITPEIIGAVKLATDETTITIELHNGWEYFNSDIRPVEASREGSRVLLQGWVTRVGLDERDIATLPLGYRPKNSLSFSTIYRASGRQPEFCRIEVYKFGVIRLLYPSNSEVINWIALDGIGFRAA